jgi:hypothetical protein
VSGPCRGAKHDLSVFRDGGLKEKNKNGKLLNVDRGYQSSRLDERCLSCPNPLDSEVLYNYKSPSRRCGETFNGRLGVRYSLVGADPDYQVPKEEFHPLGFVQAQAVLCDVKAKC